MYRLTPQQLRRRQKKIEARRGPPPEPGTVPPPARLPPDWIEVEQDEYFGWRFFAANIADLPPYCSDARCRRARSCQHWRGPCMEEQHPWYQPLYQPYLDWLDWLREEASKRGEAAGRAPRAQGRQPAKRHVRKGQG